MRIKKMKVGSWYNTSRGIGKCVSVGGTYPVSVRITITHPFPRGDVLFSPRDIFSEVEEPKNE